ncbi:MAG: MFS transporter [Bacteroidetes bacterium]|jgi:MFS family permease|nr:MFS transporter [Bacteroidota bacterium]
MKHAVDRNRGYFQWLNRDVLLLACASLFSDISTEMLYPVLPVYLTEYLKINGSTLGIIEGTAEAVQNAIQGISGYWSDKMRRRKPLAIAGYLLSAIAKPFIGIATSWPVAWSARISDRLGAGIRSAPRDALVAGSVEEENRGKAFGMEGFGDNLGAFIGPLITVALFFTLGVAVKSLFYLALIPGLLALTMILLVEERRSAKIRSKVSLHLSTFPKAYTRYLWLAALFSIGNSSNSFLILQLKSTGVSLPLTIIIYAFYNFVAAIVSYPAGSLSDRVSRKSLLIGALTIFAVTYAGFASVKNTVLMGGLFILYGLFQGTFRAVGKACAVDFVEPELRASAIGWYGTAIGLSNLIASIIAGVLWDKVGHSAVFIYGASFACLSIIGFLLAGSSLNRK